MSTSPLHGLIVGSPKTNQIYIKIDKVKVKSYLRHNHSYAKFPYLSTASIYKNSLILVLVISFVLICLAWAIMVYRTQYFTYLWRHSCLSLRIHHEGSCTKPSSCSDKIKMSKSTTGCRIKSFILVENMYVKKVKDTQSSKNELARSFLNEFKTVDLCIARYCQH